MFAVLFCFYLNCLPTLKNGKAYRLSFTPFYNFYSCFQYLEQYINYINMVFGNSVPTMNFAQAAVLVQNSANIYSKKVDFLWSIVLQLLDSLRKKQYVYLLSFWLHYTVHNYSSNQNAYKMIFSMCMCARVHANFAI